MFHKLGIFQTAMAMAQHAGTRQALVAQNMANADTPEYRPFDIAEFRDLAGAARDPSAPRATRAGHLHGQVDGARLTPFHRDDAVADPNGNAVTLEQEMLHAVDARRQHNRALAIYRSNLTLLRASIGRG